ncbi:hypothetical protein PMIN02_011568 [Paraphaeosphaeria minitans]
MFLSGSSHIHIGRAARLLSGTHNPIQHFRNDTRFLQRNGDSADAVARPETTSLLVSYFGGGLASPVLDGGWVRRHLDVDTHPTLSTDCGTVSFLLDFVERVERWVTQGGNMDRQKLATRLAI